MLNYSDISNLSEIFEMAIDHLPCVGIFDENGCYVYVNKGWENVAGYTLKEVIGKPVQDIVRDTKIPTVLKTGRPILGYHTGIGDSHQFNNAYPLFHDGKVVGAMVVTNFMNREEATNFSNTIRTMNEKLNYYEQELQRLSGVKHSIDDIAGHSGPINLLKEQIRYAANTNSTVLIEGETGSGKELVAHSIHALSSRRSHPFVKINCSAIPSELVESELFGYEGGAFTGASRNGKKGLFEAANKGSLFLDEINQMPYFTQPKLLRVLQEHEVVHLGGNKTIPVDARIIAATNADLMDMIYNNLFREDLYYRINVVTIRIPPLRDRAEDIPDILSSLLERLNYQLGIHVEGVSNEAEYRLMEYSWPGNIRELSNVLERAMNRQKMGILSWDSFKDYFETRNSSKNYIMFNLNDNRIANEKKIILEALFKNHYNKTKTADALGISRTALYKKLAQYNLQ